MESGSHNLNTKTRKRSNRRKLLQIYQLFEKLFLQELKPILEEKRLIPDQQFGFRTQHNTAGQTYRAVFRDISQAFNEVGTQNYYTKLKERYHTPVIKYFIHI